MQALRGIVLFAHGSADARWRAPAEAVAQAIRLQDPALLVSCAYLERAEPDLPAAVDRLAALGARQISVLPLFFGAGKHLREDLPRLLEQLRQAHPGLALELRPVVGEHPQLIALIAQIALNC